MTSEKQAYTLTDMGTFLALRADLVLVPLVTEGDILLNVYSVIAVCPERHPGTNIEMANNLIAFLTSPAIQQLMGAYGVEEHGMALFTPAAGREDK
jgi:tungstate transport system substrate-binding protein